MWYLVIVYMLGGNEYHQLIAPEWKSEQDCVLNLEQVLSNPKFNYITDGYCVKKGTQQRVK